MNDRSVRFTRDALIFIVLSSLGLCLAVGPVGAACPEDCPGKSRLVPSGVSAAAKALSPTEATARMAALRDAGRHREALDLAERLPPTGMTPAERAAFLSVHGDILFSLGQMDPAGERFGEALEAARSTNDPVVTARVLADVGTFLAATNHGEEALASWDEALSLLDPAGGGGFPPATAGLVARIRLNMAGMALASDDVEGAAISWREARGAVAAMPDGPETADLLVSLAEVGRAVGIGLLELHAILDRAIRIAQGPSGFGGDGGDARRLSTALGSMASLYEDEGRIAEAESLTRQALFHARRGGVPQLAYQWEWQLGRLLAAGGNTDAAIAALEGAVATLTPIRRELFSGYRSGEDTFGLRVKPVYTGLADLLLRKADTVADGPEREALLLHARDVMETLKTAEIQDVFRDECATAALSGETLAGVRRMPEGTAMIYPVMLPDRLAVLVITPSRVCQIVTAVDADTVTDTALRLRRGLQTRSDNRFLSDARTLYDWLIRPVGADLEGIRTLVTAPDGALRQFPFSALHDGDRFLVEKMSVATVPALELTRTGAFGGDARKGGDGEKGEGEPHPYKVLAGGVSEAVAGFSPLPGVPGELEAVRGITGGGPVIRDAEFRRPVLEDRMREQPWTVVHFATHGMFGGTPENTFLLTHEGPLTLGELEHLIGLGRYRESGLELLTLSACQTALGDERAALGLSGVAVRAGARSALATLWYVDDEAASLLIREFYHRLMAPGASRAGALAGAQAALIGRVRFRHPAYWSPFLMIGNWM